MKINPLIYVAIAALFITVVGTGSFIVNIPADPYYDYSINSVQQAPNRLTVAVAINEKAAHELTTCPASVPSGCNKQQPPCASKTNFNARSIRILVDGAELANSYRYPAPTSPDTNRTYSLSTQMTQVGEVCCWGVQPCSVCSDQNNAGLQGQRAFIFTKDLSGQAALSGDLFTIALDVSNLAPGNHTLDAYFLSETLFQDPRACDNEGITIGNSAVNGWTMGEQNTKYNTHISKVFTVAGNITNTVYVNNTVYVQNNTQIIALQSQLDAVNAQLANSQNLSALQISSLEIQQAQLTAQISSLTSANAQLAIDKAALEGQVAALNIILAQTQAQLTATQSQVTALQGIVQTTNNSLNTAQASIVVLNGQITSLQAAIVSTQAELNAARASLAVVTASYNDASAKLVAAQNAQTATQAQLASALSDLTSARDANVNYRISVDNLAVQLQATQLLTQQQSSEITTLRGIAITKEGIANASIALAAQKEAQAQAALSEVYRVMQEKSAADAAFNAQMQVTLAKLDDTSASLSSKVAVLNDQKALLDAAYAQNVQASADLAAVNAALSERQAALADAQAATAELQFANTNLRNQLSSQENNQMLLVGVVALLGGFLAYKYILKR